jgi:hypothetical protein
MSQIVTQENLIELESAPVFNDMINKNISTMITESTNEILAAGISLLTSGNKIKQSSPKLNQSQLISSPMKLKETFKDFFSNNMNDIKTDDALVKQKTAVVQTLQGLDYKIEKSDIVKSKLNSVLKSTSVTEFASNVDVLMEDIQEQHTEFLIKNATSIISEATMKVGFAEDLIITNQPNKTIIVASNNGKALLTEIKVDNSKNRIDISTETIGFEGEECNTVIEAFQKELSEKGLKFSNINKKWTGGNCWLPSSKTVERKLKNKSSQMKNDERRRNNLKRSKNLSSKLKH